MHIDTRMYINKYFGGKRLESFKIRECAPINLLSRVPSVTCCQNPRQRRNVRQSYIDRCKVDQLTSKTNLARMSSGKSVSEELSIIE